MICPQCKKEIPENSKFCEHCGVKLEDVISNTSPSGNISPTSGSSDSDNGQPLKTKMSKRSRNILIACISAVVVIVAVVLIIMSQPKKINLADYVSVEFSGYDTVGTASVNFVDDKLLTDLKEKAKKPSSRKSSDSEDYLSKLLNGISESLSDYGTYGDLLECIDYELSKDSDLSNGNTISLTFTFDNDVAKEYGIKFEGDSLTYTVEGLDEIMEVDPFKDISLSFSGISPNIEATVENNSDDSVLSDIYYNIDPSYDLSKGDTVTVSIDNTGDYYLLKYGYKFTSTSKEFIVDNVDEYLDDVTAISETDLNQMKSYAEDVISSYAADNDDDFTLSNITYVGNYFISSKDLSSYWGNKNSLYLIYSATIKRVKGNDFYNFKSTTVYFPVYLHTLVKSPDGSVSYDYYEFENEPSGYSYIENGPSISGYTKQKDMYNDIIGGNKADSNCTVSGDLKEY